MSACTANSAQKIGLNKFTAGVPGTITVNPTAAFARPPGRLSQSRLRVWTSAVCM